MGGGGGMGNSQAQLELDSLENEIAFNDDIIAERETEIKEIESTIAEVGEIFRDLARSSMSRATCSTKSTTTSSPPCRTRTAQPLSSASQTTTTSRPPGKSSSAPLSSFLSVPSSS